MKKQNPTTRGGQWLRGAGFGALVVAAAAFAPQAKAQVLFTEAFTGGASTTGFTIGQVTGTCTWTYNNPGNRDITGAGFNGSFAIFDSDFCGTNADSSAADLISPAFNASNPGNYILSFDQQYRFITGTVATVDVWNGTQWTTVASVGGADVGYPNPAVTQVLNITSATGGNAAAKVRFHYAGDWRWWWALDNISVEQASCAAPENVMVSNITTTGGTISWTDNGSAGYEWVITAGPIPNGNNALASGDGNTLSITGLPSGTNCAAWVRADCGDGTFSTWGTSFPFTTACASVPVPYSENFNAVTPPALPNCMSIETLSGNPWTTVPAPAGLTGNSAEVTYTPTGSPNMDSWLYTPGLQLTAGTNYRLSYAYANNSTTYTESMSVAYGTSATEAGMSTPLADHPTINGDSPFTNHVDFTPTTTGVYYIGFKCYSIANQYNLYLDDIAVYTVTDCNTTPDPGLTTGPTVACADEPFTLTFENPSTDMGISYQWETSTDGSTWANAPGNSTHDTYATSQTAATWYRVQMTCANTGTTASTPLLVSMNALENCYCSSNFTNVSYEHVTNVTFAGINNNSEGNVGGPVNYTDQVALVAQGSTHDLSASILADANDYVYAFIDWNHNGILNDAGEVYILANATNSTGPFTLPITVPLNAALGNTRMRIMVIYNADTPDPCANATYGEAEDYTVDVSLPEGVAEHAAGKAISVYPNPASTELFLVTPNAMPVHVKVFDMPGQLALEQDMVNRLNVADLAPGSYNLLITDGKGNVLGHARFVKN